jgi:hypothetical protein
MVWGRKQSAAPPPPVPAKPERTPDEVMSEMLSKYQSHFYETSKTNSNPSADDAKRKIDQAKKIISDSRVGYSICALVEHIKYWPSWSKHDDFFKHVGFPAQEIAASSEKTQESRPKDRTIVSFIYSGVPFTVDFLDEGVPNWGGDDYSRYGKVEFYSGEDRVLGVEISADTSRGFEYERWRFLDVFAFAPGEWMKHLVEIVALIDAHRTNDRNRSAEDRAIEQARNIRL